MPLYLDMQPRRAHSRRGKQLLTAITLRGASAGRRQLPSKDKAGHQAVPDGGEALTRPLQGQRPSTSNSATRDQQAADHQGLASVPCSCRGGAAPPPTTMVTEGEASTSRPAQLLLRRPSLSKSCSPVTALRGSQTHGSGGQGPRELAVEVK